MMVPRCWKPYLWQAAGSDGFDGADFLPYIRLLKTPKNYVLTLKMATTISAETLGHKITQQILFLASCLLNSS